QPMATMDWSRATPSFSPFDPARTPQTVIGASYTGSPPERRRFETMLWPDGEQYESAGAEPSAGSSGWSRGSALTLGGPRTGVRSATTESFGGVRSAVGRWSRRSG